MKGEISGSEDMEMKFAWVATVGLWLKQVEIEPLDYLPLP
jgi:hypothetical protein